MKRTMFQLYLNNADEAISFYEEAFGTKLDVIYRDETDNHVIHAEMVVFGQTLAFSENPNTAESGNTMQLCFHFGEGHEEAINKAFNILKQDAIRIDSSPGPCMYSPHATSLIDRYGVNWCLFI